MSQRDSGYARKANDLYETPAWVTEALLPHLPRVPDVVWEPAAGGRKMSDVLERNLGRAVYASDITDPRPIDFLDSLLDGIWPPDAIITNPPYDLATEFIEHALGLMERIGGMVAMLLRADFDHAKTRQHLFATHPAFAKKVALTKRIRWFEDSKGSPSFNHAWMIWDWQHEGPPTIGYGP